MRGRDAAQGRYNPQAWCLWACAAQIIAVVGVPALIMTLGSYRTRLQLAATPAASAGPGPRERAQGPSGPRIAYLRTVELQTPDPKVLEDIARWRMPFGRYQGHRLVDLPEPYVVWFRKRGFPKGRLGVLFEALYTIKENGLEPLLDPLREPGDPRYRPPPRPSGAARWRG